MRLPWRIECYAGRGHVTGVARAERVPGRDLDADVEEVLIGQVEKDVANGSAQKRCKVPRGKAQLTSMTIFPSGSAGSMPSRAIPSPNTWAFSEALLRTLVTQVQISLNSHSTGWARPAFSSSAKAFFNVGDLIRRRTGRHRCSPTSMRLIRRIPGEVARRIETLEDGRGLRTYLCIVFW